MSPTNEHPIEDALPLTPVVFHTLLALSRGPLHGYAVSREVENASDNAVRMGPGTLYGTLQRLMDQGVIKETEVEPTQESGHEKRRRYYALTPSGRRLVEAEARRLSRVLGYAQTQLSSKGD